MNYKPYCLLAFLCLAGLSSFSQDVKTVALNKYTQTDGLSSYFITKITQDSYGFMWIGTQEGLNLFDGRDFCIFSKEAEAKHRLGGSFVIDMIEDKKRKLMWVLTAYGDICAIDLITRSVTQRIVNDKDRQALSGKWIRSLTIQGDTLWFAGARQISGFNISEKKFILVDIIKKTGINPDDFNIAHMTVDQQNRLWLFSDGYGILVLDKKFEIKKFPGSELANERKSKKLVFQDLAFNRSQLYIGTSWGIRIFKTDVPTVSYLKNSSHGIIDTAEILSLAFASPTCLFFATPGMFYSYDYSNNKTESYHDQTQEEDWLASAYQVYCDTSIQKIWIGGQSGFGSFSAGINPFTIFSRSFTSIVKIKHAYSLLPVSDREIYCGDENGLFYVRTDTRVIDRISAASSNLLLFRDLAGNVFVSNKSGFFLVKGKSLMPARTVFPELAELDNDRLSSAVQFNDSLIFFGSVSLRGLTEWNTRTGKLKFFHDTSGNRIQGLSLIDNLFKTSSNKLLILTDKSIIQFDPLTEISKTLYIRNNQSNDTIVNLMDMCETKESYWIATYGNGLIETDKNFKVRKIITTTDGLSNNCIYKLFPYKDQSIFATTNNGLNIIKSRDYKIQKYFESDGLHSSAFEQVCGYQYNDKIYAGGVNGFTIIDPAGLFTNTTPPKLYFNTVDIKTKEGVIDTSNIFLNKLTVGNTTLQVTISLSALNYKNPRRTSYAYKIVESGGDWIDFESPDFKLPSLSPGKYTLLFRSMNEAGVWNEQPITLSLIWLPKWYQTRFFEIIVILFILGLFYLFYRFRLHQIKKQQHIRKTIANDLHDDIGSVLNSANIFTHLAKKEVQKEDHLNSIEEALAQASVGLRDMIWVLDDTLDTPYEIIERIKKYALPVCLVKNINFHAFVKTDNSDRPLTKTEKRNFLLITKESINNSIKYSDCTSIQVALSLIKGRSSLTIKDDGKGFDVNAVSPGNGLKNIYHRAQQIRAIAQITSSSDGTTVLITRK